MAPPTAMHRTRPLWHTTPLGVLLALLLVGCGADPEKLLEQIGNGDAASALETLESARTKEQDPAKLNTLRLLEAYARVQLCAERQCVESVGPAIPTLLQPLAALLTSSTAPAPLGEGLPTLSSSSVVASATALFATLPNQPTALLALRTALPATRAEAGLEALIIPALNAIRAGATERAAIVLSAIESTAGLSEGYRFTAGWLAAMLTNDNAMLASRTAALRAQTATPEVASVALLKMLPHALWAQTPSVPAVLSQINAWLAPNALTAFGALTRPEARFAVATELATLAATPPAAWQNGWDTKGQGSLSLVLQRASLGLNPNQPSLWQTYLNGLIGAVQAGQTVPELMLDERGMALAQGVAGPSRPELGKALLAAAQKLQNRPSAAAPLLYVASQLNLASAQQAELDKLAQTLLVKAAEAKDISATFALSQARPQAAANNRQLVVPLLVEDIKASLRNGQFARAISTTALIETQLNLPVELGPLVLDEFTADFNRRGLGAELDATTPNWVTQPQELAALELGPLWGFMETYFADRPEVLRGQLTTLISAAKGPWGPPSAMHRLLQAFPASDRPAQTTWLHNAIIAASLEDTSFNAPALAKLSGQLLAAHPGLNVAPLLETTLARATTLEENQAVWEATPANVRPLLRQLRPQFAALMRGLEAYKQHDLDAAAKALAGVTEGQWLQLAEPALQGMSEALAPIAGLYVPISATPGIPLAALWVEPQGLKGGDYDAVALTFLNRLGTLAGNDPRTYVASPAKRQRLTLQARYKLNIKEVALETEALASAAGGSALPQLYGPLVKLSFKANPKGGTLLIATLSDGKTLQLSRVLNTPTETLRPDGIYSILTSLEQTLTPAISGGSQILPPGSMLTLQTAPTTQPATATFGFGGEVYPLLGTLQHPASPRAISFTGEYDASTLTSGFTFSYPLKSSGQPVRAGVLCQSLAGTLHCGAHHLHSPRVAFAALSRGQQTQESLATAIATRQAAAVSVTQALLQEAATARQARIAAALRATVAAAASTSITPSVIALTAVSATTTPTTPLPASPTSTLASPNTPNTSPSATVLGTAPEEPLPGVFIYRGQNPAPSSPTLPPTKAPDPEE